MSTKFSSGLDIRWRFRRTALAITIAATVVWPRLAIAQFPNPKLDTALNAILAAGSNVNTPAIVKTVPSQRQAVEDTCMGLGDKADLDLPDVAAFKASV